MQNFVDWYARMVYYCAEQDRDGVLRASRELGFLTGEESDLMLDTHVEAGFTVGLPFSEKGNFDFSQTDLTRRVQALGQVCKSPHCLLV